MTDVDEITTPIDGRVARRQRNIEAVLDVVLEMFAEDAMFPSMEQAAKRSGLSLRSLYRYFADPGELREAAIARNDEVARSLSKLHAIGEGSLDRRIDDFVGMRVRLYRANAAVFRATVANAARHRQVNETRARNRALMREQFELQFAPELGEMDAQRRRRVIAAGDLLTQLDSLEFLREYRGLSEAETRKTLASSLQAILSVESPGVSSSAGCFTASW
ncbi:MAG: TetR/AcrR family transcriptional regulator [Acidimicrobiales bacterium]